jgi:DNA sulfur modification protein DndD
MIALRKITLKQFRAYEDVTIDFNSDSGVFLMSGDNGSGKSTLLNAINWCLYGDTPFYTTIEVKEVLNRHAPEGSKASVEIYADINNKRYRFYREAYKGASGGVLSVMFEDNGNWLPLDGANGQDAVRRILPKDIRHLFFFNGERLKDIFSRNSEHDLKSSVYKVSELNIIDSAISHLKSVEDSYLRQISKQSQNAEKIERFKDAKDKLETTIKGHDEVIAELRNEKRDLDKQISELDKLIKDTAVARQMIDTRDRICKQLEDVKDTLNTLNIDKMDCFQSNYHRLILQDEFEKYSEALEEASEKGLIPPPVSPKVTERILRDGRCICNRPIGECEREFIQSQHDEYSREQELQFLTDGIYAFSSVNKSLSDAKYIFKDILDSIRDKNGEKIKLEEDLKKINTSLEDVDVTKHDNPEFRRTHLENKRGNIDMKIGGIGAEKLRFQDDLKKCETELKKNIDQDTSTKDLEDKRQKAHELQNSLHNIKGTMEKSIRNKLKNSVWEVFSSILPNTNFRSLEIDDDYAINLEASDGVVYQTSMLATGPTKVLGLSLAYGLSKDLGYTDVPLLIDNLYGDVKDTHYLDITRMISSLAKNKQVVIMDLNIEKTELMFEDDVISQKFQIERSADDNKTIIEEIK